MRALTLAVFLGTCFVAADAHAQRVGYIRNSNQNNDYRNWDKPVDGTTTTPAKPPEAPEKVTYGALTLGEAQKGHLDSNETHYFQFRVPAATRCLVELAKPVEDLQLAFLDDATRVAALGEAADLKPGTYFLRLKTRAAADYEVTLQCSAP
jgi:hypothetical protein